MSNAYHGRRTQVFRRIVRLAPVAAWILLGVLLTGCVTRYHPETGPYNQGVDQLDQGRYADALASFKRALELRPHDYRAEFNLGVAFEALGKSDQARDHYAKVIQANPGNVPARLNLAALARLHGNPAEARRWLEEAVARGSG